MLSAGRTLSAPQLLRTQPIQTSGVCDLLASADMNGDGTPDLIVLPAGSVAAGTAAPPIVQTVLVNFLQ
jgi:hypothetical protein